MTLANKSLQKKIFHRVENVIKQLVHTSAVFIDIKHLISLESTREARCCSRLRLKQLLRIFRALQTFRVLHISMNTRWCQNQLLMSMNGSYIFAHFDIPQFSFSSILPDNYIYADILPTLSCPRIFNLSFRSTQRLNVTHQWECIMFRKTNSYWIYNLPDC